MPEYFLTNKAIIDLSGIWEYTFKRLPEKQADKYYESIIDSFESIAEKLAKRKSYEEIYAGLLGYKIGNHIIFYKKYKKEAILIIRILHSRMDLRNRLNEL